ncbi:hypothetical protein RM533_08720 [Croceicoccus sp. F390]|uniref:Uncharacterized protein n=1 Tax=Croceicoccus esteveae TaxID=3075597 RepID=A0ABU2ZI41_9SPHN|nr:hypothetical protein [Croceicoccus sp. F390]MDT0576268.1 hypothetical protein [Croceicoccus sp. F390]
MKPIVMTLPELTGKSRAGPADADALLETYINEAGPDSDAEIVRVLHRKLLGDCLIIAGPDASEDHIVPARIEPVLHLAGSRAQD